MILEGAPVFGVHRLIWWTWASLAAVDGAAGLLVVGLETEGLDQKRFDRNININKKCKYWADIKLTIQVDFET